MRQIEFRAKTVDGQWVCGDLHTLCNRPHIHIGESHFPYAGKREFIDPDTVGQFTGMRDVKGNKIYEGDIVVKKDLTLNLTYTGVVVYYESIGAFRLLVEHNSHILRQGFEASDSYNDGYCTIECKYEYEVIGNICDNKNLLAK